MTNERDGFLITTDNGRLDVDAIHDYLCNHSYWAGGIPRAIVEKSLRNSLCFGVYDGDRQIGLARVVSDYATYAYLCDVYILDEYRGRGLGKWLVQCVLSHPELQGLRKFALGTRDAQELYRPFGFSEPAFPGRTMYIQRPDIYKGGR